jgi:UTP-glucose-1-phosphate uridylyltransferase
MAAGAGSRFGGPKQLEPVGPAGERLFEYALFDARRAGFDRAVIVVREDLRAQFADVLAAGPTSLDVRLAAQRLDDLPSGHTPADRVKPWGTTHAVLAARQEIGGPFAVANADDFYGPATYARASAVMAGDQTMTTVVAMRLDRTLSTHGSVTRGICDVSGGRVTRIDEVREVMHRDGKITGRGRAGWTTFSGGELASMNAWVFPLEMLRTLEARFLAFLQAHDPTAGGESMLPETVNDLIAQTSLPVGIVEAPGPWFGLTHAADRPLVESGLRTLTADGVYPSPLWKGRG